MLQASIGYSESLKLLTDIRKDWHWTCEFKSVTF